MNGDSKKESKNKVRFNILDAIIILVVLLCIAGIVFRYTLMDRLGLREELTDFQVTFRIEGVNYTLPGFLKEGDRLYFDDGTEVGELLGVAKFSAYTKQTAGSETLIVRPSARYITDSGGRPVYASYPEFTLIDADGAFICRGTYSSEGYFLLDGKKYLAPGQRITLYTDTVTLQMTITGISPAQ
ncbi:MAG: hypothetical protein GX057_03725 [Clostridiales bacterium]|jgi:hypothetical protein|nr:hypothetical protein [Clostridiales bacterium]HOA84592.1 DUF4330 family protein [Bacillota bacterium]